MQALTKTLRGRGCSARHLSGADQILERLEEEVAEGDVVIIMSNGGFDGLHQKLLDSLATRHPVTGVHG